MKTTSKNKESETTRNRQTVKPVGRFRAVLSDMDGVFRTVPFHYLHECTVRALEGHVPAHALEQEWVVDLSSSDLFVNESDSFLEFCYYALTDPKTPLPHWHAHAPNTPVLYQYLMRQRATRGPPEELPQIVKTFDKLRHGANGQNEMKPIAPALEGLQRLIESDVPLCVVSNSPRQSIRTWFSRHGIRLEHVIGSDDVNLQKPHPEGLLKGCNRLGIVPSPSVAYTGDLPNDVTAARAASLTAVGIAYADRLQRLKNARPDFIFSDFGQFARFALDSSQPDGRV